LRELAKSAACLAVASRPAIALCRGPGWRGRIKNSVLLKNFGNFVSNFREEMANDKHYPKGKTRNQNENTYETKP